MSLDPNLEGLWQLKSIVTDGRDKCAQEWHYLFQNGTHKEIVVDDVDDGKLRSTYTTDLTKSPHQLEIILDYNGPDGPPDPEPIILRAVYQIDGDELRITYGLEDEYPKSLTDNFPYEMTTLIRDFGPIPEMRKPSNAPPRSLQLVRGND